MGPTQKFIRKGSKEERDCRKAVARLLRSGKPLTQDFRDGLAGLFDRARGRRRDHVRDTAIAMDVYHNIRDGDGVEEALNKASTSFGPAFRLSETFGVTEKPAKGLAS